MRRRVLQQVAEDALEADPVDDGVLKGAAVDVDGQPAVAETMRDPIAELGEVDGLGVQVGGAGVDPGQLEQVDVHDVVEPAHLVDDDVERLLRALGQSVAWRRAPRPLPTGR